MIAESNKTCDNYHTGSIMKQYIQQHWPFAKNKAPVSFAEEDSTLPTDQDLIRAGALLARERNFKDLVSVFVEQAQDISRVDLSAFYILKDIDDILRAYLTLDKISLGRSPHYVDPVEFFKRLGVTL